MVNINLAPVVRVTRCVELAVGRYAPIRKRFRDLETPDAATVIQVQQCLGDPKKLVISARRQTHVFRRCGEQLSVVNIGGGDLLNFCIDAHIWCVGKILALDF